MLIWILICVLFLWLSYAANRDFASPVFISGTIWLGVYFILFFTQENDAFISFYYGVFVAAFICFFLGFFFTRPRYTERRNKIQYQIKWNKRFYKVIVIIAYFFVALCLLNSWRYITARTGSIWMAVRRSIFEIEPLLGRIIGLVQNIIPVAFFVSFGMWLCNPIKTNRNAVFFLIPPLFMVLLLSNRGDWFYIIITTALMVIYIKKPSNQTIVKVGITGVIAILIIFIISSFDKFSNAWTNLDKFDKLSKFFEGYFEGPPIAFIEWLENGIEHANGAYTFRFLYAVFHKIFTEIEVVDTIQPFITVNGISTNVYTSLQWYAHDFGIVWVFVVEIFLGIFYGKIYKNIRKYQPSLFSIILLSMLLYPIVNQFFDDKIFSIFSIWIQRIFWLYLFTKTRLCIQEYACVQNKSALGKYRITIRGRIIL